MSKRVSKVRYVVKQDVFDYYRIVDNHSCRKYLNASFLGKSAAEDNTLMLNNGTKLPIDVHSDYDTEDIPCQLKYQRITYRARS